MGPQDLPVIAAVNEERWPGKWVFIWKYTAFLLYLSLKQLSITQVKVATTIIRLLWACSSWVAKRESLITYAAWFLEFMSVPPGAVKFSLPVIVYKNFTVPLNSYSSTGSHSLYFTVPTSSTGYSETAVCYLYPGIYVALSLSELVIETQTATRPVSPVMNMQFHSSKPS